MKTGKKKTKKVNDASGTHCVVDGYEIKVMSFKGTGVCSELCRKRDNGEITEEEFLAARAGRAEDAPH